MGYRAYSPKHFGVTYGELPDMVREAQEVVRRVLLTARGHDDAVDTLTAIMDKEPPVGRNVYQKVILSELCRRAM